MSIAMRFAAACGLSVGLVVTAGCRGEGGSGRGPVTPSVAFSEAAPGAAEATAQYGGSGAVPMPSGVSATPPASASPSPASADRASAESATRGAPMPESRPRERPGLGTAWGETRASHVHDVDFVRNDEERPFAVATFNYDDARGVDALAGRAARWEAPRVRELVVGGGAVSVSIRDGSGEALEALRVGERSYVVGREGERFAIVLENHTDHRFEAVATVDGLDVIDGKTGSLGHRGYVVMPYATLAIDGFRQSQDAVAAFRFAKVESSYAAQTGRPRNVGVIGVALFGERGDPFVAYPDEERRLRDTASPFPARDPRYAPPPWAH